MSFTTADQAKHPVEAEVYATGKVRMIKSLLEGVSWTLADAKMFESQFRIMGRVHDEKGRRWISTPFSSRYLSKDSQYYRDSFKGITPILQEDPGGNY